MKKIFSFMAMTLLAMSSFAALTYNTPASTWTVGDEASLKTIKWNSVTTTGYAAINNDWYIFSCYDLYKATKSIIAWTDYTATGSGSGTWSADGVFQGKNYYESSPDGKMCCTRTDRIYSYQVKNMSAVYLYCKANIEGETITMEVYDGNTLVGSAVTTTINDTIINVSNLDKDKTYTIAVGGSGVTDGKHNSFIYEIAFSISGEYPDLTPKAVAPSFSVADGEYHEAFQLELTSSKADAIYYSINGGAYQLYSEPIQISEFDVTYQIDAYATLAEAENSDIVSASYLLTVFIPRPVFQARKVYEFAGITADEVKILTPATAELGTYTMSGKDIPAVSYKHETHEDRDSFMYISAANREEVKFLYKNGADKANMLKFADMFVQADGAKFEIWIDDVQGGDTIVFVATAKGATVPQFDHAYSLSAHLTPYMPDDDTDPCFTDGLVLTPSGANTDDNYAEWQDLVYIVDEGQTKVRIKEMTGGFRIAKILVGAYREGGATGVENVFSTKKATKRVENGQVVIIKADGRKFNLLGAEIK